MIVPKSEIGTFGKVSVEMIVSFLNIFHHNA